VFREYFVFYEEWYAWFDERVQRGWIERGVRGVFGLRGVENFENLEGSVQASAPLLILWLHIWEEEEKRLRRGRTELKTSFLVLFDVPG
jgi:hypothetical protein